MSGEQLVLLTLDLGIKNLWENALVKKFPETSFVFKNGSPAGKNCFSGLLKIENGNFPTINRFARRYCSNLMLDRFHNDSNLFFYLDSKSPLGNVFGKINCVLNWPVQLKEDFKRVKVVLKENAVEDLMTGVENSKMDVLNFSKVRVDFGFNEVLTPKQKEVLDPSLKLGYYEFPKKINLNCLAGKLNLSPSTLCVHLQKIENKILNSNYSELLLGV